MLWEINKSINGGMAMTKNLTEQADNRRWIYGSLYIEMVYA
jgi:hypothetical protein